MQNDVMRPYCDVFIHPNMSDFNTLIEKGQFLDINKTCIFKARQLEQVALMFQRGEIERGDTFWVADIFFPGLEMIRYMAELQGLKIKIYAFNHAGRADPSDFIQALGEWADMSEQAYHDLCDGVFVGSMFHAMRINTKFRPDKIYMTGPIWDVNWVKNVYPGGDEKEPFIIWPHRVCKEKGIDELIEFAKLNPNRQIRITTCGNPQKVILPENVQYCTNLTKREYYQMMSKAKWYLSNAHQETFGYTLQEAIVYGCHILVPDRACYPEMTPPKNRFKSIKDINDVMLDFEDLRMDISYTMRWHDNVKAQLIAMGFEQCAKKKIVP